jgi:hypothetical protein
LRDLGPPAPLERERPRDHADGQRADLEREIRNDRRRAGAGAPALACRDEDHVGAFQRFLQLVARLLRGRATDVGVRAGAEPAGGRLADVDLHVGVAHLQRLRIRVDADELDAGEARVDHPVDGVRAAAADADDLDHRDVVSGLTSHRFLPLTRCFDGAKLNLYWSVIASPRRVCTPG